MIQLLSRRWTAVALLIVLLGLLTACGGAPPANSWPGLLVDGTSAYVASSDQILGLDTSPDISDNLRQLRGWPLKPSNNPGVAYHSQPALSDDHKTLYLGTDAVTGDSGAIIAVNLDTLTLKWTYPMTETDPNPGNIYGGIVQISNTLYLAGGNGYLMALSATNGLPIWPKPFDTGARIWSTPAVSGNRVYVASQDHHLYAVSAEDGTLIWKFPAEGAPAIGTLAGSPSVFGDTVYVGSFDGNLYAVGLNGQQKWVFKAGRLWDPPVEVNGTLFFGDLSGNVYALDAKTAQPKWPQPATVVGGVRATPLVANGVVYIGTDQFKVYALDATNGRSKWQAPYAARDGDAFLSTPALSGSVLVIAPNLATGDPIRLYGLNKDTGAMLWRFPPVAK